MKRKELKIRSITQKFEIALVPHNIHGVLFNINLRELHTKLKNGELFATWIKDRIEKYDFVENKDYILILENSKIKKAGRGGDRRSVEYIGTLSMAKELAMIEHNEIGKIARQYFIHCEEKLHQQSQQSFMPRGYPQMLEAARNDWKRVRNELIDLLSTHLQVYDRKKRSQFTNQIYLNLIETTARRLREHFLLTRPNQLTRDYLHQLVQESIVEIEIRLSDALMSGSITSWEEFKTELERIAEYIRYMKEMQNGRIALPQYAYPTILQLN